MRHIHPRQLQFYRTPNGREPFAEWYDTIQDLNMQNRIDRRLERVANGNLAIVDQSVLVSLQSHSVLHSSLWFSFTPDPVGAVS